MIILATIQHTGTWCAIDLLERAFGLETMVYKDYLVKADDEPDPDVLHVHIADGRGHCIVDSFGMHPLERGSFARPDMILRAQREGLKVITTVRDPMLSVISRENRHPGMPHSYIPLAFDWLCRQNLFVLPIDLMASDVAKRARLWDLRDRLGLSFLKGFEPWGPTRVKNANRDVTGLKVAYLDGNLDTVAERLPVEFQLLVTNNRLKEWLRKLGYNLPWFDHCGIYGG